MTKPELRRAARARLRGLDPRARLHASEQAARHVWTLPQVAEARVVLLFASLPDEVETAPLAAEAARRGIAITYPRCLPETREMALHHVGGAHHLLAGTHGIPEPHPSCPVAAVEEVDAALVPGLAWDRAGIRLGRGAGYYDRLFALPGWRGYRCGLFFAAQEWPALPADPWDAPLHAVVTEHEAWRVAG